MSFKIKGNARVDGKLQLPAEAINRALTIDADGEITSSLVTSTELETLSGVTGDIQTQLDAKIDAAEKGAPNGVATLDALGKIPATQLPNSVMEYKGSFDASTNTPTLTNGTGNAGDVYRVSVAGTVNFGAGPISFLIGDLVIYNGTIYERSPASDAPVLSVNGQTGVVVLDADDVGAANKTLSNLDTPTALNQDLLPDADETINIGSSSLNYLSVNTKQVISSTDVTLLTEDVVSGSSGSVQIQTGGAETSSGSIILVTGAGAVQGDVVILARQLSMSNSKIVQLGEPTDNTDAATKQYVDGAVARSEGDISETSFSLANNQASPADVTDFLFAPATVRSFEALVSVEIDATAELYEVLTLRGIQKNGSFDMTVTANGDDSGVVFTITNLGQVQYISANNAGFVSGLIKFRAQTTTV